MRQLVRSLMLLAVIGACTPDTRSDAERSADAARADSSAAGYDVGPATNSQQLASVARDSGASRADSIGRRDTRTAGPMTAGSGSTTGAGTLPSVRTDSAALAAGVTTPTPSGGRGDTTRARTTRPTDSGQDSTAITLQPLSPAVEASFLVYDSTKRTATFQLAAGNEFPQVSFNGVRRGMRTLTVPVGWRVTIEFANRDPDLPHSAVVVAAASVPEQLPEAAFAAARTVRVAEGLLEGDSDELSFVADRAGRYLLACGVLGHAQNGQWLAFEVSPTATVPRYR